MYGMCTPRFPVSPLNNLIVCHSNFRKYPVFLRYKINWKTLNHRYILLHWDARMGRSTIYDLYLDIILTNVYKMKKLKKTQVGLYKIIYIKIVDIFNETSN